MGSCHPIFCEENCFRASKNPAVRFYFERHSWAGREGRPSRRLRARMESLFASEGVRLALSGTTAPDFRALQNEGKIVLVNCAGPSITRGVRLLLQGLVLSDIRKPSSRAQQSSVTISGWRMKRRTFSSPNNNRRTWPTFSRMARSFAVFAASCAKTYRRRFRMRESFEQLHTNIRWSLTLRGTHGTPQFLRAALPVTGRRLASRPATRSPRRTFYSSDEERSLVLEGIAHLPDRTGYLWLKTRCPEAIKIKTTRLALRRAKSSEV